MLEWENYIAIFLTTILLISTMPAPLLHSELCAGATKSWGTGVARHGHAAWPVAHHVGVTGMNQEPGDSDGWRLPKEEGGREEVVTGSGGVGEGSRGLRNHRVL